MWNSTLHSCALPVLSLPGTRQLRFPLSVEFQSLLAHLFSLELDVGSVLLPFWNPQSCWNRIFWKKYPKDYLLGQATTLLAWKQTLPTLCYPGVLTADTEGGRFWRHPKPQPQELMMLLMPLGHGRKTRIFGWLLLAQSGGVSHRAEGQRTRATHAVK